MKSCITVSGALYLLFKKQHDDYIPKYTVGFPQALSFALLVFVQRIPHPTLRCSIPLLIIVFRIMVSMKKID